MKKIISNGQIEFYRYNKRVYPTYIVGGVAYFSTGEMILI